jgi:inosose dehydratase
LPGKDIHRRQFLNSLAIATAGLGVSNSSFLFGKSPVLLPNPVGYATIAWPNGELDHAVAEISQLGFKGIELVGWIRQNFGKSRLPVFHKRLKSLNLQPVSLYCFPVRPFATASEQEVEDLSDFAVFYRSLGGLYLEVTDGLRPEQASDPKAVKALAKRLDLLGKVATEHGLGFGYHPHVGSLGESRKGFGRVLEASDPRYVRLIADVAHLTLGGSDPAEVIRTYHDRLLYLHFKDARKDAAKVARKNAAQLKEVRYWFCDIGTGAVNFPSVMRAIHEVGFKGWIIIELDRYQPIPGGPDKAARVNKKAVERLGLKV